MNQNFGNRGDNTGHTSHGGRRLYIHNANVTLMRTSPEECAELGRITAEKLNGGTGEVAFLMPLRGVSAIDAEGMPFWWPEADRSYLDALKSALGPRIRLLEIDAHINDESFSRAAASTLLELMKMPEVGGLWAGDCRTSAGSGRAVGEPGAAPRATIEDSRDLSPCGG